MANTNFQDERWLQRLKSNSDKCNKDIPNYYVQNPEQMHTTSRVHSFMVGTGDSIFEQLQTIIESTERELILVTCFWAESWSRGLVISSLRTLSDKAVKHGSSPIRVFIGLSSLSLAQKLFQTNSLDGRKYGPKQWTKQLGLPPLEELPGLDITVKSIFVKPFSVMHPKFVVVDRKLAWLPSCNVSWEKWFEGAVVLSGSVVQQFVVFWESFWLSSAEKPWTYDGIDSAEPPSLYGEAVTEAVTEAVSRSDLTSIPIDSSLNSVETWFLPSPHHAMSLCIPFLPDKSAKEAPPTPLNAFLLNQIQQSRWNIYIQTPNLTSFVVMRELLDALRKGTNIQITTSEKLMILEQLVTAGTTTARCVTWFIEEYKKLRPRDDDVEASPHPGHLKISYFEPQKDSSKLDPVQSHIKLSIFDSEVVVLGSQNMDRASWYTSQELGVAFRSKELVRQVMNTLNKGMEGRHRTVYDSTLDRP